MIESDDIQLNQRKNNRFIVQYLCILFTLFLILFGVLLHIQLNEYQFLFSQSEKNYTRVLKIQEERGLIKDRYGQSLVKNKGIYAIRIYPNQVKDLPLFLDRISKIKLRDKHNPFDLNFIERQIKNNFFIKHKSVAILNFASEEIVAIIEENNEYYLGAFSSLYLIRDYPYKNLASHLLGYASKISDKRLRIENQHQSHKYSKQDYIGISGLEKQYENVLRGRDNYIVIQVDAKGQPIHQKKIQITKEEFGYTVVTTIDLKLQQLAEDKLKDFKGSIVVLDPRNGDILALASNPTFDPNTFSLPRKEKLKVWNRYRGDSSFPLLNRSITGVYDPASIFKVVVSITSFREGIQPYQYLKPCRGFFRLGTRRQKCWLHKGHGSINFYKAFERSCDVYYYQLGLKLGINKINTVARELGLGSLSKIDLPYERSGLLMDSVVYERKFKKKNWKWTKGLLLNLAIGQGLLVTPLQLANLFASITSPDGKVYQPHLLKEIRTSKDNLYKEYKPKLLFQNNLTIKERKTIIKGLKLVVEGKKGTGRSVKIAEITIGGKSGSAEIAAKQKTNALFGAVAPLENPEIVVVVILERAGHGGAVAAPIVRDLMRFYFDI